MVVTTRAQWPHTVEDIVKSLDGIWGLVGATGINGNLFRLERSLHQPLTYTLTEFQGSEEGNVVGKHVYQAEQKNKAIKDFAKELGFN